MDYHKRNFTYDFISQADSYIQTTGPIKTLLVRPLYAGFSSNSIFRIRASSCKELISNIIVYLTENIEEFEELKPSENMQIRLYSMDGSFIFDDQFEYMKNEELVYACDDKAHFPINEYLKEFDIVKELGQGAFGKVFLGKHRFVSVFRAIKCRNMAGSANLASEASSIYQEAKTLNKVDHPNIIKFFNVFYVKQKLIIFMEYAKGGELTAYVDEKGGYLAEKDARAIFLQIINAVDYCHGKKMVHRDLKLDNILFLDQERKIIKIIDFGISGLFNESSKAGTVRYLPPEILSGEQFQNKPEIDLWSLGVILYRLVVGEFPFKQKLKAELIQEIVNEPLLFPNKPPISYSCKSLISKLLEKKPNYRIKMYEVFSHKWIMNELLNDPLEEQASFQEVTLNPEEDKNEDLTEKELVENFKNPTNTENRSEAKIPEIMIPSVPFLSNEEVKKKKNSIMKKSYKKIERIGSIKDMREMHDGQVHVDISKINEKIYAKFYSRRSSNSARVTKFYSPPHHSNHYRENSNSPRIIHHGNSIKSSQYDSCDKMENFQEFLRKFRNSVQTSGSSYNSGNGIQALQFKYHRANSPTKSLSPLNKKQSKYNIPLKFSHFLKEFNSESPVNRKVKQANSKNRLNISYATNGNSEAKIRTGSELKKKKSYIKLIEANSSYLPPVTADTKEKRGSYPKRAHSFAKSNPFGNVQFPIRKYKTTVMEEEVPCSVSICVDSFPSVNKKPLLKNQIELMNQHKKSAPKQSLKLNLTKC